jgi:hypothetical protein
MMGTKVDVTNSYRVTFVFDYTTISACVFAMHGDACESMAIDIIKSDTGMPEDVFDGAQDVLIELLDKDVL